MNHFVNIGCYVGSLALATAIYTKKWRCDKKSIKQLAKDAAKGKMSCAANYVHIPVIDCENGYCKNPETLKSMPDWVKTKILIQKLKVCEIRKFHSASSVKTVRFIAVGINADTDCSKLKLNRDVLTYLENRMITLPISK